MHRTNDRARTARQRTAPTLWISRSLALSALLLLGGGVAASALDLQILVFSRTEGFRHGSISDGIEMIQDLAAEEGWIVTETEETDLFTDEGLAPFHVVIWLSTTGDVLDDPEQEAFERYIQKGGGYLGIHAAADCEYGWPWYGELLGNGAWFDNHPSIQDATLVLEDPDSPMAGTWESETTFNEEWYNFRANPRDVVDVIQTLDEDSYSGGQMGDDHPIAWSHTFDGGRAFYTGLGHRGETYEDDRFREQIRQAIDWTGVGNRIRWRFQKVSP